MIATEPTNAPARGHARPNWIGWLAPALLAVLPWAWFVVRDADPRMNAVAFALPPAAAALAILVLGAAALTRLRFAIVAISLCALAATVVVAPRLPRPGPAPIEPFRLVAANTYDGNAEARAAARALLAPRPDVLIAVETPTALLGELRDALPGGSFVRSAGLNVFARWPMRSPGGVPGVAGSSAMRVEVRRPGSPFVVYAIHLPNPLHEVSFSKHASIVARLLAAAERERLPVVMAGDFNMADRYTSYRVLDGAMRDAMRSSFAGVTYERRAWALFQLRIDHVFVSPRWCSDDASTFSVPGSDHEGLSVELGRCR